MPQHVIVSEYDPAWPDMYQQEKEQIVRILGENCLAVYHIGSTSVPGLAAKPVIDIMAAVRSLEKVEEAADRFSGIGYESCGEFGIPGRRYLRKGGDERTHQIHIFQGEDWGNLGRHLAFRDYLRAHERERQAYGDLKKELARRFPYDIEGYCDGKDAFVRNLESEALTWYDGTWDRLYLKARMVQYERQLSKTVEAGGVSAALLTDKGGIYTGVCIDTACSLGMCAERNAIANMITNGESRILKLIALMPDGRAGMPCGACRELMMQLGETAGETEILLDQETKETVRLKDLMPRWWYEKRMREND